MNEIRLTINQTVQEARFEDCIDFRTGEVVGHVNLEEGMVAGTYSFRGYRVGDHFKGVRIYPASLRFIPGKCLRNDSAISVNFNDMILVPNEAIPTYLINIGEGQCYYDDPRIQRLTGKDAEEVINKMMN